MRHPWYIAVCEGLRTTMRVADGRAQAIKVACGMLDRGMDVIRLGPMQELRDPEIDAASIRDMWQSARGPHASSRVDDRRREPAGQ